MNRDMRINQTSGRMVQQARAGAAPPGQRLRRTLDDGSLGARALRVENLGKFGVGQFVSYNDVAILPDGTHERIEPGAFTHSLKGPVVACLNHDVSMILGSTHDDTLVLFDALNGLRCLLDPRSLHASRHGLQYLVRLDAITGMSFRFQTLPEDVVWSRDLRHKTVLKANLVDVSVLTKPHRSAYRKTWVRFTHKDAI